MPVSRPALACAIAAGLLAGVAVAEQRVGLALTTALLLAITAGALGAERRPSRPMLLVAVVLALQPTLRDAGWVVTTDLIGALVATALAVGGAATWPMVCRGLLAPWQLVGGTVVVARAVAALRPEDHCRVRPVARGLGLAAVLVATFGALFAAADSAYARVLDQTFTLDVDGGTLVWRAMLAVAFVGLAGSLIRAGVRPVEGPATAPRLVAGRLELRIALAALLALFASFVVIQLRVLFGGAGYVQATTGLGYGDYARQGFVALLVVAALTLAVIAVAARERDRVVRWLVGGLCVLTLVVLASAHHRLDLVESAYGFTRVRYAGHAIVIWLAAIFVLLLTAHASPATRRQLPRLTAGVTCIAILAFTLSNPDARIASSALERAERGGTLDTEYLADLSADALPTLERLPSADAAAVLPALRSRLARRDGFWGANLARSRAR